MKYTLSLLTVFFFFNFSKAQIINIPDPNFKNALINTNCVDFDLDNIYDDDADTNDDGEIQLSEAQAVLGMAIYSANINSMEGIEHFENIVRFYCDFNSIDELDLSNNINLELISCNFNGMTSLNVSNLVNLKDLMCEENNLTNLDLSDNINIEELQCDVNFLENLDLSNNLNLLGFSCTRNNISNLDLTNNINLEVIVVGSNLFTSLDLSNNINLETFYCSGNTLGNVNQLTSVDFSDNVNLRLLTLANSPNLTSINLKNGSLLDDNGGNSASINGCPNLTSICVDPEELNYIQTIVNNNGYTNCEVTTECTNLSIEEYTLNNVKLYPNPSREKLFINSISNITSVTIYDIDGSIIKEILNKSSSLEIDVEALSTGIYFLKINSNRETFTTKIIKN